MADLARQAEEAGVGALWAVDHLFWHRPMPECLTTLAVAAATTRRPVLGSCVLQLPLRSAPAVAKQAAALQHLSGGRFVLGVGLGSHRGEYQAAGVDFTTRGRALDAGIDALRNAWGSAGRPDLPYRQEPAPPPVPLWVGGSSPAALARAATRGDGWIPMFLDPPVYAAALEDLRRATAAAGRAPEDVTPAVVILASVGTDPGVTDRGTRWLSALYDIPPKAFERHLVAGPAEHCAGVAARFLEAGAEHVVVMVADDRPLEQFVQLSGALAAGVPRQVGDLPRTEPVEVRA